MNFNLRHIPIGRREGTPRKLLKHTKRRTHARRLKQTENWSPDPFDDHLTEKKKTIEKDNSSLGTLTGSVQILNQLCVTQTNTRQLICD